MAMTTADAAIRIGDVGHGSIGSYGPANWRYLGPRAGAHVLQHVQPQAQSRAWPEQYVDLDTLLRVLDRTVEVRRWVHPTLGHDCVIWFRGRLGVIADQTRRVPYGTETRSTRYYRSIADFAAAENAGTLAWGLWR